MQCHYSTLSSYLWHKLSLYPLSWTRCPFEEKHQLSFTDEWIDGKHQKCATTQYRRKNTFTLCHNRTAASIKRRRGRPNRERKMEMTGWHLINDDSCTHGHDTTCTHALTHNGSTLMSFLSLHLLLRLFSLCTPLSCQWNSSLWSERSPLCRFSGRPAALYFPLFRLRWNHVMILWNVCNTHCSSSAGLCRNQTFYVRQAPLCESRRAVTNTFTLGRFYSQQPAEPGNTTLTFSFLERHKFHLPSFWFILHHICFKQQTTKLRPLYMYTKK